MKRVALLRKDDAGERAGKHDVAGLERVAVRADLVRKPGHAECRMTQDARSEARLLDLGIAGHDPADPSQVDVERADRPPAHSDAGSRAVVRYGVDDLARILDARVDDLD